MTGGMTAHPAVPLRPQEVPDDLKCCICFGVPQGPAITPCEHLFCNECITTALESSNQPACPICRSPCSQTKIKPLSPGTLIYRIWSGVQVKCALHESGCSWTGSIVDAAAHRETCQYGEISHMEENRALTQKLLEVVKEKNALEKDMLVLLAEKIRLVTMLETLETEKEEAENQAITLVGEKIKLQSRITHLETKLRQVRNDGRLRLPVLFKGEYDYTREDVVQLSQFISRYLHDLPPSVDRNKIYNCVRNCYLDLQRDRDDNPELFYEDMRMLLTTCASSSWFTVRQHENISHWLCNQGWD